VFINAATAGSANTWLGQKFVGSGELIVIESGYEVFPTSKLYVSAELNAGGVTRVLVGGYAVKVWTGEMPS
jgi:hypothetical protein